MSEVKDTRESVEENYDYMVFDYFIDKFQAGEITYDEAIEAFQHVKSANQRLGEIAIKNN